MNSSQKNPSQIEEDGTQMQKQQISFLDKLNNIIETMESKYTCNLTDRHVDETQKLIKEMNENNYSFYYLELAPLSHLISLQFKRVLDGKKEFLDVLLSLVEICNRPFLKQKTSDELNYVPKTVHLLNAFSEILQENLGKEEKTKFLCPDFGEKQWRKLQKIWEWIQIRFRRYWRIFENRG